MNKHNNTAKRHSSKSDLLFNKKGICLSLPFILNETLPNISDKLYTQSDLARIQCIFVIDCSIENNSSTCIHI